MGAVNQRGWNATGRHPEKLLPPTPSRSIIQPSKKEATVQGDSLRGSTEVFDAIVVGSGATGGWAAKELTEAGLRVALVEAGRMLVPEKDFTEHLAPYQVKYRGFSPEITRTRPIQTRCYACMEYNYDWFVNDYESPYTTEPGKPF